MLKILKGIALLWIAAIPYLTASCDFKPTPPTNQKLDTVHKWVNWVSAFKPDTKPVTREQTIEALRRELLTVRSDRTPSPRDSIALPVSYYLRSYLSQFVKDGQYFAVENVQVQYCNCGDSLLFNVEADILVDGSGSSVPKTPPPPPKTKVSGDPLDVLARNDGISDPNFQKSIIDPKSKIEFPKGFAIQRNAVIAVIDTGIDTLLMDQQLRANVLMEGPDGSKNALFGANVNNFSDDHPVRHGSSVASIALSAFYKESNGKYLPRLLVLKALDSTGTGSVFEFSCAMSYAIRHHVTAINASLGYYGERNELLEYYVAKSTRDSIPLIAAAGNSAERTDVSICQGTVNTANLLSDPGRLFFPGCVARDLKKYNVISVTGFSAPGVPCYYQNYSDNFVTLGVMNTKSDTNCCSYSVPFMDKRFVVEGSSFATPVVSGRLTFQISRQGRRSTVPDYLSILGGILNAPPVGGAKVTRDNSYIQY